MIVLEVERDVLVDRSLLQQPDKSVTLPAFLSKVHNQAKEGLRFDSRGVAERWLTKDEWLSWNFKISQPGTFDVVVLTSEQKYGRDWEGGHDVIVELAGQKVKSVVDNDGKGAKPRESLLALCDLQDGPDQGG